MLIELYIFYEILVIALFLLAFFTKQEIIWAMTAVFSGVLMFSSYDVQTYVYQYNETLTAYVPTMITTPYIYLSWINMLFFVLAMLLGIFDLFDKYGTRFLKKGEKFGRNTKNDEE